MSGALRRLRFNRYTYRSIPESPEPKGRAEALLVNSRKNLPRIPTKVNTTRKSSSRNDLRCTVEAQKRLTNDNVVITVNKVIQTTKLYPRFVVGILLTQNGEGCLRKAKAHVRRPVHLSGFEIGDSLANAKSMSTITLP